uniref:Uncharacterized protein n=1 Tax=Rousettus aegyptiacus TaxID=9407 RepID=A0A7J8DX99_ROUAE|nr:hypothetical protein HJG63_008341 [Rousettus aegyptiacus]
MPKCRNSPLNTMNNQGDKASQKKREKSPENELTDIEICDSSDREFRMVLLKKLNEILNDSYQQLQKLKKQLHEQSKEIETLEKNRKDFMEIKNTLQEFKNKTARLGNRVDQMEERIRISKTEI